MKTPYRKRAQAKLLQLEHEKIRKEYNKHFFSLTQRKMNDLDKLKDVRERIQEIYGELDLTEGDDQARRSMSEPPKEEKNRNKSVNSTRRRTIVSIDL